MKSLRNCMLLSRHPNYYKSKDSTIKHGSLYKVDGGDPEKIWANSKISLLESKDLTEVESLNITLTQGGTEEVPKIIFSYTPVTEDNLLCVVNLYHKGRIIKTIEFNPYFESVPDFKMYKDSAFSEYSLRCSCYLHAPTAPTPVVTAVDQIEGSNKFLIRLSEVKSEMYDVIITGEYVNGADETVNVTLPTVHTTYSKSRRGILIDLPKELTKASIKVKTA